eukprot:1154358-Pelagomonas_calceolata.AAC.1
MSTPPLSTSPMLLPGSRRSHTALVPTYLYVNPHHPDTTYLHVDTTAGHQPYVNAWQQPQGGFTELEAAGGRGLLKPRGSVHCVTKN